MSYVNSNSFSISVNRDPSASELGENGRIQSTVTVYKGDIRLTPVSTSPTEGQFRVLIGKTQGCTASIKNLDTVYVNDFTKETGTITLNINVEGKAAFVKNINLIKSVSTETIEEIEKRVKIAEQKITEDAIINMVKEEFYTKGETLSKMSLVEQTVDSWGVRIIENEKDISSLKLTSDEFEVRIGSKADSSNIISMINASTEGITISSSKVSISGYVTFSDLSNSGSTVINGNNITTGYISGNRIKGGIISATDEINFVGGARIFGNTGGFGAGLTISAAGFSFSGGSINYLGGNWYLNDGDLELESGDLTVAGYSSLQGVGCSGMSCSGNISVNGTAWISTLSVSGGISVDNYISASSTNTTTLSVTSTSWLTDVSCSSLTVNGVAVSSDARLKTDIKYVNTDKQTLGLDGLVSPNVNITTSDMHEFIETLPMVSYRLISELNENKDNTYYGFLIQDIMETKVGSELVITPRDEYGNETNDYYSYSQNKFIAFICGALQEEIKQRKLLEEKLNQYINKEE